MYKQIELVTSWYAIYDGRDSNNIPDQDRPIELLGVPAFALCDDGRVVGLVNNGTDEFIEANAIPGFIDLNTGIVPRAMVRVTGRIYRQSIAAKKLS
jgi:hypothetical protein